MFLPPNVNLSARNADIMTLAGTRLHVLPFHQGLLLLHNCDIIKTANKSKFFLSRSENGEYKSGCLDLYIIRTCL